ncbi:hypothetical protein TcBrA4_0018010 [Trypanosoma cruzi]|nr:hypothetical protein TcBrA4_0018010 [Trypanosoma cruzi]
MPHAAPKTDGRNTVGLRAGKTPVKICLEPTPLRMAPLVPKCMVQHEWELPCRPHAEKDITATVDGEFVLPLRFHDVLLERRLGSKLSRRRRVTVRFVPVMWDAGSIRRLKFEKLTSANSCFSFV